MDNIISVKTGIGHIEYTEKDLSKEIQDLYFLKDAVLTLINPKVAEKSDLPFDKEQVLKYLKEMFLDTGGYNKDFINKIFTK